MAAPLAILGLDVGEIVEDAVRALVDLVVPDLGADWVSQLVVWLVALPPITGEAFPSLNRYAHQLTAVGFGLLGACFLGGLLQLWAGGLTGLRGPGESVKRAAIAAGALVSYPVVLEAILVGTNILTAQMIRHPLVEDGLDKAFGGALVVAAVTGGLSLGLAVGAAVVVLYFLAALVVMKIGLTTALAVAHLAGALVWGLYPLPQAAWLARAWSAALVAALIVPVAWACVFAAAALLAADTLVFDGGGRHNQPLGDALQYLVKPLAAVACFWLAYRTPAFLLGLARSAGLSGSVLAGGAPPRSGDGPDPAGGGSGPAAVARSGVQTNADRFRALAHGAHAALAGRMPVRRAASGGAAPSGGAPQPGASPDPPAPAARRLRTAAASAAGPVVRANRWWRELPAQGRRLRTGDERPKPTGRRGAPAKASGDATERRARPAAKASPGGAREAPVTPGYRAAAAVARPPEATPRNRGTPAARRVATATGSSTAYVSATAPGVGRPTAVERAASPTAPSRPGAPGGRPRAARPSPPSSGSRRSASTSSAGSSGPPHGKAPEPSMTPLRPAVSRPAASATSPAPPGTPRRVADASSSPTRRGATPPATTAPKRSATPPVRATPPPEEPKRRP